MEFLSMKRRVMVEVPDDAVKKTLVRTVTANGERRTYLLQATDPADGSKLRKFASKATFEALPGEADERVKDKTS